VQVYYTLDACQYPDRSHARRRVSAQANLLSFVAMDQKPEDAPATPYTKDTVFYLEEIVILVEGCLFKVPKAHFQNGSEVFRQMFTLPASEGCDVDGSSDDYPLRLDGITKDDFVPFLKAMFPRRFPMRESSLTADEWTSVLKLANMWSFDNLRGIAIKHLAKLRLEPVQKIALAMDYHLPKWLVPALNRLAQREQPLGRDDLQRLGADVALKIAEVRGAYPPACPRPWEHHSTNPLVAFRHRSKFDFRPKIFSVFGPIPT